MQDNNIDFETRDYFKEPLTESELTRLIGKHPIADFISTRARTYAQQGWDRKMPTKKQAIAAMLKEPTLLKRPILVRGEKRWIGFSQSAYEKLV